MLQATGSLNHVVPAKSTSSTPILLYTI